MAGQAGHHDRTLEALKDGSRGSSTALATQGSHMSIFTTTSEVLTPATAGEDVNPLHYAAAMGDKRSLRSLLEESLGRSETHHLQAVHARDAFGRTALVYAVVSGRLGCAELLVAHGTDVNAVDKEGRTAMHWAAFHGRPKMIKMLLGQGADVQAVDAEGRGAMHLCGNNKSAKCFAIVAKAQGAHGHWVRPDQWGLTPLHWASFHGSVDIVKVLLKHKVPSLSFDREGKSAFHWAAATESTEAMKLLLAAYASYPVLDEDTHKPFDVVNTQDVDGRTCLHIAVASGQERMVEFLLSKGALSAAQDTIGRTPLMWAAQLGHVKVCKTLLARKRAEATMVDANGTSALHYAAQEGHSGVVSLLLGVGLKDHQDSNRRTALMLASLNGSKESVKLLLAHKSDARATDSDGHSALHMAAYFGYNAICEMLINAGSEVDLLDHNQCTPLLRACENGHDQCVVTLVTAGADTSRVDEEGESYLHWAAVGGHAYVCQYLVAYGGIHPDVRDAGGRTAAATAAFQGHHQAIAALIEQGANVNLQDDMGISALHWSAHSGSQACVQTLVERGQAFTNHTEHHEEQMTPLDYALASGHDDVAAYLRSQGALTVEEVRDMAATHIKSWWKGYRARITLLSMWKQHRQDASDKAYPGQAKARRSKKKRQAEKHLNLKPRPGTINVDDYKIKVDNEKRKKRAAGHRSPGRAKTGTSSSPYSSPQPRRRTKGSKGGRSPAAAKTGLLPDLPPSPGQGRRNRSPRGGRREGDDLRLPPISPATSPLPDPSVKRRVVSERKRKSEVRAIVDATITIQRAARTWLRRREEVRLGLRPPLRPRQSPPPPGRRSRGKRSVGGSRSRGAHGKGSSSSLLSQDAARRRQRAGGRPPSRIGMPRDLKALSRLGDPRNKEHQVAALTIQLAWRQYLRRAAIQQKAPRVRKVFDWSPEVRAAVRLEQQTRVYARPMAAVPQWKPRLKAVRRPSHFDLLPSPAITSFNFAVDAYFTPLETVSSKLAKWERENAELRGLRTQERSMREEIAWMKKVEEDYARASVDLGHVLQSATMPLGVSTA